MVIYDFLGFEVNYVKVCINKELYLLSQFCNDDDLLSLPISFHFLSNLL